MLVVENSDTVTRIKEEDREIVLIGTAHVSKDSVDEVASIIRGGSSRPCLCRDRFRPLQFNEGGKTMGKP